MQSCKILRITTVSVTLLMTLPLIAFARPKPTATQMEKKTVEIGKTVTVDGKTLAPGKYEVFIENNKAEFEQDGRTLLTARCQWKSLDSKSPYDSTQTDKDVLQEIEFQGSKEALDIL